ncbi:MAG: hypothetical protein Q8920_06830, partial [Bacillota bacterium]|nr:hypothetical protein [Bacillota bacterium]
IFSSTLARSYIISAVMSFIIFIALSSFGLLPKIGEYSPSFLGGIGTALMHGKSQIGDVVPSLISCIVLTAVFLTSSVVIFKRQEL